MTQTLPELALSIRQPWAWAVIFAQKDIENRAWRQPNPGLHFRGRIAIHAAKGMTKAEYEEGRDFIDRMGWTCPDPHALHRGGIIGSVEVVDCVKTYDSRWFFGPRGIVLRNPEPCAFIPASGALGYFRWQPADRSTVPEPARWMLPQPPKLIETIKRLQPEPDLFGGKA